MSENKEIILRVKDLRISFRTVSGKVQAVRGISFDLVKGETLAIVGESGSGKSVTNRAIMGILAKNGIIESGEVLYDGRDLLKISEPEFCNIRGDKIAMIFQDPLSSLNPIIRIGRQLTEATLLKNKANRRDAKANFNRYMTDLQAVMDEEVSGNEAAIAKNHKFVADFETVEERFLEAQTPYEAAFSAVQNAKADVDDLVFNIANKVSFDLKELLTETLRFNEEVIHPYVVSDEATIAGLNESLSSEMKSLLKKKSKNYESLLPDLKQLQALYDGLVASEKPDLFAYAYYFAFVQPEFPAGLSVSEKNRISGKTLNEGLIAPFEEDIARALKFSNDHSRAKMKEALSTLKAKRSVFVKKELDKAETALASKELVEAVKGTIDKLALIKDSYSYTFDTALSDALGKYFRGIVTNERETKRYAKQKATYDAKVAKGKTPDWKPVPANVLPTELLIGNITNVIDNLANIYSERLAAVGSFNEKEEAKKIIPFLREQASLSVYKITNSMAKTTAIRLMKEVGIPEPRKRFRQYPFEFSGGMRQRIVIAIALTANPDILICDEPTTALDVTIQAQILELINQIKEQRRLSVIFITHNLGVVANMANKIAVMYAGKIVEFGQVDDIFYDPRHPYTWALLSSMPDLETKEKLDAIPGTPPNMIYPPEGDAFAPRNKYALNIDFKKEPPMFRVSPTHYAATWLCDPRAPKVERPKIVEARIELMKSKYGKEIEKEMQANLASEPDEAFKDFAVSIPTLEKAVSVKNEAVSAPIKAEAETEKKPVKKATAKKGAK